MKSLAGEALRELRAASGLSQAELAERAGTCQAAVSLIETGRRDPRASTYLALAMHAGADDLLSDLARLLVLSGGPDKLDEPPPTD